MADTEERLIRIETTFNRLLPTIDRLSSWKADQIQQYSYYRAITEEAPKRVKNRDVILLAYSRWVNGTTQAQMNDEFPVSLRTINTWVGWFKDIPQREVELDKVGFHYHQMEDYGIAWDKYEEVMRLVEEYSVQENVELTPRMAKWAWRLQQINNPTFGRDKAKEFIKKFVEAEQEELIGMENEGRLNKVSQDLQFELSRWQTTPIGRTHNES